MRHASKRRRTRGFERNKARKPEGSQHDLRTQSGLFKEQDVLEDSSFRVHQGGTQRLQRTPSGGVALIVASTVVPCKWISLRREIELAVLEMPCHDTGIPSLSFDTLMCHRTWQELPHTTFCGCDFSPNPTPSR